MELVKISELPIKEITTVDAYLPIIDNVGDEIENYRISLLNLFKTGGIINVNRTYGDTNYTLQTALAVIEPTLLVNGVFITFKCMDGWELYQKELDTYVKYLNRIDNELELGSNNPLTNDAITRMYNGLLSSINNVASIHHYEITDKNGEPEFQHVTQTEKTNFVTASDFVEALIENATSITHEELLNIINNNELIPNSSYRITNYTTTTVQADTTSAGHDFDIIVTALSTNELSENASCVRKVGDTYFENANLETWEIKYFIHNDTSRFAWADSVNGKGVIYYMKDEWGNECPYDFKNIQFKKSNVFLHTFGGTIDDSLTGGCHHNTMMSYISNSVLTLNFNTFGINCKYNTFGNACYSNTFGNNCQNNKFGIYCQINTFGNACYSNTFGDNCFNNTFGNNCYYNTFGDICKSNNFYHGTTGATKKDYLRYIVLEDGCSYNNFYSELTTSNPSYLQRIRIKGLEHTTATNTQITLPATNTNYEWIIYYTTDGVLKQLSPDYSLINNYTYKIEDTSVSTWTASTAYAGYDYQTQINIPNLTENDNASVIFDGAEVISGNYYPIIQIYEGYILIFSKVNATITIPTIEITKIDL